jgi:hypothetical protein
MVAVEGCLRHRSKVATFRHTFDLVPDGAGAQLRVMNSAIDRDLLRRQTLLEDDGFEVLRSGVRVLPTGHDRKHL